MSRTPNGATGTARDPEPFGIVEGVGHVVVGGAAERHNGAWRDALVGAGRADERPRGRLSGFNERGGEWLLRSSVGHVDPLVVTLVLDDATTARFDAERRELFPAGRTAVGAHVTLFHAVPGELLDAVRADVERVCAQPPFPVTVTEVFGLGRGVAYRLAADRLVDAHRTLQRSWWEQLTAQDRQGFRAHVTVQNKVTPDAARRTLRRLQDRFAPFEATAVGLAVWRYVGGPWEPVTTVRFAAAAGTLTV